MDSVYATVARDRHIRLIDSKAGKITKSEKTRDDNYSLAFSPDGNIMGVSNTKDELMFYDFRMWKHLKSVKFNDEINDFCWD